MTREEAKELIPIIQAFADGKTIEFFKQGEWMELNDPDFMWSANKYRIKPEPKYRPFKTKEECWNEMQKHQPFGWIKSKNDSTINKFMFIDSLRKDEVSISNIDFNYNDLVEYYIFADGVPFGIEEK